MSPTDGPPRRLMRCSDMSGVGVKRKSLASTRSDVNDPEVTWDNWASVVLSKALIFRPYNVFAVDSFELANGEMTPSHLLKMLDKRVVHGGAA